MTTHEDEIARIYLDVDGVFNAVTSEVPAWGWSALERKKVNGYPITYSPDLIEVINEVAKTPGVGVYWLTTWCHDAPEKLCAALGIQGLEWPVVGYEHWRRSTGLPWWKHLAIVEHLEGFTGPVLWVDDDHGVDPASVAWLAGQPQILAMAPATGIGITRDEARIIQRFARAVVPGPTPDHDRGLSWPTTATVDLMLAQLARDRQTPYWGSPPHVDALDDAEAWLLSLRDWLGGDDRG